MNRLPSSAVPTVSLSCGHRQLEATNNTFSPPVDAASSLPCAQRLQDHRHAFERNDLHDLRKHLDLPEGAWTVLMAGRLTPGKAGACCSKPCKRSSDAHAIFLGDALFTEEDRWAYARELRETASQAPLERRVHFAGFRKDTATFFDLRGCGRACLRSPSPSAA